MTMVFWSPEGTVSPTRAFRSLARALTRATRSIYACLTPTGFDRNRAPRHCLERFAGGPADEHEKPGDEVEEQPAGVDVAGPLVDLIDRETVKNGRQGLT